MRQRRLALTILTGALTTATLAAQTAGQNPPVTAPPPPAPTAPAPADQGRTTFRSSVDVVAVDVSVVDSSGRPISDIAPEEFVLTVDGQPRRVRSAEFVSLSREDEPVQANDIFSTNKGQRPGRLIVLVIDQAHIRRGTGRETFSAASDFLGTLNRSDRVALHLLPGTGPMSEFSSNHALVKKMLERAAGQQLEGERTGRVGIAEAMAIGERDDQETWDAVIERECAGEHDADSRRMCQDDLRRQARDLYMQTRMKTRSLLSGLRDIVEGLALIAEPKTLVLVSEGLVLERGDADLSWVESLTAEAHVGFFGIRLSSPQYDVVQVQTSPTREKDAQLLAQGFEQLIGLAKGDVYSVATSAKPVFNRLGLELSGHYLLSFEPESGDRDGKLHDIGVRVRRRDALVRARRQFSAEPLGTVKAVDTLLAETLRSPLSAADFDLKVTTFSFRDDATDRIKLIVGTEFERTFNAGGEIALAYQIFDAAGKVRGTDLQKSLLPAKGQDGKPQSYLSAVVLDPGIYTVKVVAVDGAGRRASVERTFEAKLTAVGQLRLGELMLTETRQGEPVRPIIDGHASETMTAYLELYSAAEPQLQNAAVTIEVASTPDSQPLISASAVFGEATTGKRVVRSPLAIGALPPGRYVARAILSVGGRPAGRTSRPFSIDVPTARPVAADRKLTPVPFLSEIESFDRRAVLTRPVMGFFIDRMALVGLPVMPESLMPAVGYARMGQFTEVRRIVDSSGSDHLAGAFLAGIADLAHGRLPEAAARFTAALKASPGFFPAAFYLGACYAATGQDREAVLVWRSATVSDPAAPWAFTLLADALLRLNELPQALDVLREATRLWADDDDVRMRWATALARSGQGDAAARVLAVYLARRPADEARLLLGMRLIYEARVAGRPVESMDADRATFLRYFELYSKTPATDMPLAAEWRRFVER